MCLRYADFRYIPSNYIAFIDKLHMPLLLWNIMEPCVKRRIVKVIGASSEEVEDLIAVERQKKVLSLFCTPTMIKEFVIGFLLNEGIINGHFCADSVTIKEEEGRDISVNIPADGDVATDGMVRTSGCIGGITFDRKEYRPATGSFSFTADGIRTQFKEFNQRAGLFKATGCVHSAAVSDGEKILVMSEDIGRHNAVDKVIGHCIIENVSFEDKMMLVSGRLSSEIVSKCARWGIPLLVSRTSPTSYAVEIAEKANITLIGFVRGECFNIYSNAQRIR